jgi:hypothetical protein
MAMTPEIEATIRGFNEIILEGVPLLLKQNETAFLSFICSLAAIDALSSYRYTSDKVGVRFEDFIKEYFPTSYAQHAPKLYLLRCRILHNFSPAYFSLTHSNSPAHLKISTIGDTVLSSTDFFADLKIAAEKFFAEVSNNTTRQDSMNARLSNIEKGGAIYYE